MREIKFKGKRIDTGEWVYGYLFKTWDNCYILWGTTNNVPNMVEVIPETVGQYTGLKDKNGKEIYEANIVKAHYIKNGLAEIMAKVTYSEEYAQYVITNTKYATDDYEPLSDYEDLEVIGNVYDNKNLLDN